MAFQPFSAQLLCQGDVGQGDTDSHFGTDGIAALHHQARAPGATLDIAVQENVESVLQRK